MKLAMQATYSVELTQQDHATILRAVRYLFENTGDDDASRLLRELGASTQDGGNGSVAQPAVNPVRGQVLAETAMIQGATIEYDRALPPAHPTAQEDAAALAAATGNDPTRAAVAQQVAAAVARLDAPLVQCSKCNDVMTEDQFCQHAHPAEPATTPAPKRKRGNAS